MKKLTVAALITVSALTLAACSNESTETVVETDAGNITKEEFYEELKDRYGEQTLGELVAIKVLEDNYEVTDEMVEEQLEADREQFGENFEMILQQSGFQDEEQYADFIYVSLLQEQAATEGIEVTDEEIEQYYERMKTEIDAQHILVADQETADKVKGLLDDGGDFGELAAEYSMDGSAQDEGNLGFFTVGSMVKEFEDAAYSMEPGDISDPVQSEFGFHIIKVNEKRDVEDVGSLEDEEETIRQKIQESKIDMDQATEKITQLIEEANVDVKIEGFEDLFAAPELDVEVDPEEE